jgi:hypothetical protein
MLEHVEYKFGDDTSVEWVDDAFRESLAAIQERSRLANNQESGFYAAVRSRLFHIHQTQIRYWIGTASSFSKFCKSS